MYIRQTSENLRHSSGRCFHEMTSCFSPNHTSRVLRASSVKQGKEDSVMYTDTYNSIDII